MQINKLILQNFRNYNELELDFNSSRNIIVGENAQGKTNLIEAIYMCAFSKSFRTNNVSDLVGFDSEIGRIDADIVSEELDKNIKISVNRKGKKMIVKDGKVVKSASELLNNLVVVIFSPDDLRIIKDSPERRRNFINRELSQLRPNYYDNLHKYNDALKQKNTILKSDNFDEYVLDAYDDQISRAGYNIIKYRRDFIKELSAKAAEIHACISGNKEVLETKIDESVSPNSPEEMFEAIVSVRNKDLYHKYSSIGPHRDDLVFYINGKDAKKYGSQGQQRTIALSLKLAEIKIAKEILGENPILLLDDVLSELDLDRQSFLINEIEDVQLFITSTEIHPLIMDKMKNASLYKVDSGNIVQINSY